MVTYDPEQHFTAGDLRGIHVRVPEDLPDWAFISRTAVHKPEAWATMRTPADVGPPPFRWEFSEPWTLPEGKSPECEMCWAPAVASFDCETCGDAYRCGTHPGCGTKRSLNPGDLR